MEEAAGEACCGWGDDDEELLPPGRGRAPGFIAIIGVVSADPHLVFERLLVAFKFPPKRGVSRQPCTEPVPLVLRICNTTILMIRAIFFSTKGMAIVVIIGEYVTMKPCQCMSGREQIPPYSGHGNP